VPEPCFAADVLFVMLGRSAALAGQAWLPISARSVADAAEAWPQPVAARGSGLAEGVVDGERAEAAPVLEIF